MNLKQRIAVWYIARRLRIASGMSRKEWRKVMKPFPKWMAIVFGLVSAGPAIMAAIKTGDWATAVSTVVGVIGLTNTHSLMGTGGKPVVP